MGYIAECDQADTETLRKALVYGTVVASYNVEDFSLEQMKRIEREQIDQRFSEYCDMLKI